MVHDLILLAVGFLLTTVLGGALGSFLQRRAWNEQYRTKRRDEERARALRTFEDISKLMDRRLHRMRRLNSTLLDTRHQRDEETLAALHQARQDYRSVIDDWNDNLNRMLALAEISFGQTTQESIARLQEEYASIGRALNIAVRQNLEQDPDPALPPGVGYARRLKHLSDGVYAVNIAMLSALSEDALAPLVPDTTTIRSPLSLGDQGKEVRALQIALRRSGYELTADGAFGLRTHRAVRIFQREHGLPDDGIAGPATLARLPVSG